MEDINSNVNSLILQVSSIKSILANTLITMPGGSPTLRHVKVGIRPIVNYCFASSISINPEKTQKYEFYLNAKNKICAGYPLQRADKGDSGGPLLYRRNDTIYQIGLVEMGYNKGDDIVKLGKLLS